MQGNVNVYNMNATNKLLLSCSLKRTQVNVTYEMHLPCLSWLAHRRSSKIFIVCPSRLT